MLWATTASAQHIHGVVVDQTGLPLPGATVEVLDAAVVVHTLTTADDGSFDLSQSQPGEMITARLEGFEPVTVPRLEAMRIVLHIARTTETTDVVASILT